MKNIEIIAPSGSIIADYSLEGYSDIKKLFNGYFFAVEHQRLIDYSAEDTPICNSGRFVYVNNLDDKSVLAQI